MNTRGWLIAAWLVVGHAVLGGLYWGLLQIPESNALMLTASLVTALAMIAWTGTVEAVGIAGWSHEGSVGSLAVAGLRKAVWIVPALAVFAVVWLLTGAASLWLGAHRGEMDAWIIAKLGWTETGWLHTTVGWTVWIVRYGLGVALAVACLAAGVLRGISAVLRLGWVGPGLTRWSPVVTAGALLVGFYLPWRYVVYWRPASLPPTAAQPAFASAKLAVVYVVMNVAWLVVLWWAARVATPASAAAAAVASKGHEVAGVDPSAPLDPVPLVEEDLPLTPPPSVEDNTAPDSRRDS